MRGRWFDKPILSPAEWLTTKGIGNADSIIEWIPSLAIVDTRCHPFTIKAPKDEAKFKSEADKPLMFGETAATL
ncbi:MAG: hypothetical protein BZY88_09090 [SAR202 cluster bacterium Io17-Chloro-G9]|nr:MAG: hypothetical protein BZY88_09090 [SAR202 cluster bacterium Io17-Chloro-G9]